MPASVLLKTPVVVPAKSMLELEGSMSMQFTSLPCGTSQFRPVMFQVAPASVDFSTPTPLESPASTSPVPIYMMFGLAGSMMMALTPSVGRVSVLVDQVDPPSVVFQMPPLGAPTNIVFGSVG